MEQSFELTKPDTASAEIIQGEELIRRITALANSRRQRRPVLEAWSFRIEKRLHAQLDDASKTLKPVAMSDIVNGLLEIFLPLILAQRVSPGEKILADPSDRAELTKILGSLTELLQKGVNH